MRKKQAALWFAIVLMVCAVGGNAAEAPPEGLRQWTGEELAIIEQGLNEYLENSIGRAPVEEELSLAEALALAERAVQDEFDITAEEMAKLTASAAFFHLAEWENPGEADQRYRGYCWNIEFVLRKPDGTYYQDVEPYGTLIDSVTGEVIRVWHGSNG